MGSTLFPYSGTGTNPYQDPQWPEVSSLRREPWRNSTTRFTLAGGPHADKDGRPAQGDRTFWMGPGERIVGGQLRYAYLEKTGGKVKLEKSLDPAEILRQYRAGTLTGSADRAQTAPQAGVGTGRPGAGGLQPTGAPAATSISARNTAVASTGRKVVYYDGKDHHVIDAPPGYKGSVSVDRNSSNWTPPHLEHKDVEPGRFLGVVETPGAEGIRLIGSKHRMMPDFEGAAAPGGGWAGTGRLAPFEGSPGQSAETLARTRAMDSVRTYGLTHKPIGYKEYEATCKQLDGLNTWERTQSNLNASMLVGRPSRLMSPFEHTTSRLSLKRPTTSAAAGF